MALPLMLLTAGFARTRQPSVADARYGYQSNGRHETAAATMTALITAGVGLTLATALVIPEMKKKLPDPFEGWSVPTTPAETVPPPTTDRVPTPEQSSITTVQSPLPPLTGTGPVIPYTPVDLGPIAPIPGPTADPGPIADPPLPHTPLFRAATRNPRFAERFQPPYPSAMQREQVEGDCPVSVTINGAGRVTTVRDLGCTDAAFFRATERQALSQWRFNPATRDGEPVESTQTLTVRFRITDDR